MNPDDLKAFSFFTNAVRLFRSTEKYKRTDIRMCAYLAIGRLCAGAPPSRHEISNITNSVEVLKT